MKRDRLILAGIAALSLAGCTPEGGNNTAATITNDIATADNSIVEMITDDDAMGNVADIDAMDAAGANAGEGNSQ